MNTTTVIPGRPKGGPGIQMNGNRLLLDSGFARWRVRPGMTKG